MRTRPLLPIAALFVAIALAGCTTPYRNVSSLDGKRRTISKLERLTPLGTPLNEVTSILKQHLPADTVSGPFPYNDRPGGPLKHIGISVQLYKYWTWGSPFVAGVREVRYEFDKNGRLKEIKFVTWYDSV